ncbi:hypothetical protein HanXRQr2_Chr11g0509741 [Helianthus annuus]|uniref:Uncharacterized protein n=1 Tax=Helianthus annuus TaxID=4232 RepID=A0A9K3N206_HELAN|nr:hypothetical protein HanXRQr2_Chr11g0509741 [Helianthus annuus]
MHDNIKKQNSYFKISTSFLDHKFSVNICFRKQNLHNLFLSKAAQLSVLFLAFLHFETAFPTLYATFLIGLQNNN